MTGLASNLLHICCTACRALASSGASRVISRYLPTRTPETDAKPSVCSPPSTALPWGSSTTGLRVTCTRASQVTFDGAWGVEAILSDMNDAFLALSKEHLYVIYLVLHM